MDKSLVKNAADPKQVKAAKQKEKSKEEQFLIDIQDIMKLPAGRRFMWEILGECKTFGSVWESSARIHYNSGRQDLGHWLMAQLNEADEGLFLEMMKENYKGDTHV